MHIVGLIVNVWGGTQFFFMWAMYWYVNGWTLREVKRIKKRVDS